MNTFYNTRSRIIIAVLGGLSAVAPMYSGAADVNSTTTLSRKVSIAGLNLNTTEGASEAYARVKSAARSLCSNADPSHRAPSWVTRECIQTAVAHALRNANRQLMTQAFVADYGAVAAEKAGLDLGTRVAKQ
jgi:UrcA family protein